jgi:hypothetical protein
MLQLYSRPLPLVTVHGMSSPPHEGQRAAGYQTHRAQLAQRGIASSRRAAAAQ